MLNYYFYKNLYFTIIFTLYITYFITFTNIIQINPIYIEILETINIYFISFYLLYRFNPYRIKQITDFDKRVVFDSSVFLIFTHTFIGMFRLYFIDKIKKYI